MGSFAEFELALRERFPHHNQHGVEFERAAKWMLERHPNYASLLRRVWHYRDWPGYWGPDDGVDLVAEDHSGALWAIQVKCFLPDHSVTKAEIDSFLAASGREVFSERLLLATTDLVGQTADRTLRSQEKPVRRFMRDDFVKAPLDWPADPVTLDGGGRRRRPTPHDYQQVAIDAVVGGLEDRGQLIMACGTGKTLTALWIKEALGSNRSLVLVPSLTLLSQFVAEWKASEASEFRYLPVCSDDSVASETDALAATTSDLPYPVTTDPNEIAAFLREPGPSVVFSTYQSSPKIAEAQSDPSVPAFDVVFADEAHRCAGKVSSAFGTVLHDDQIRARKRLFMTATPRIHVDRTVKDTSRRSRNSTLADDDSDEAELNIASMDDEELFGPLLYQLSFAQAIEDGLLTDYRVVATIVTDDLVQELIDNRHLVKTESGFEDDAKSLAALVGLSKAIRDHGLTRTITFHSRVKSARGFADRLPQVVEWMNPDSRPLGPVITDHISGKMATGIRNARLNGLREIKPGEHGVVTNARCLSEGVDVPTLDGVGFIDPKRSQVDIVQAVGRAIRLADTKEIGTIIVPVYVPQADDPETIIEASDFKTVVDVVRALKAHDSDLQDELDQIRIKLGSEAVKDSQLLPEKLTIDAPVSVDQRFVEAIHTHVLENTTSIWLERFALLCEYVERTGTAVVPKNYVTPAGYPLGIWVAGQRGEYNRGNLSRAHQLRLESFDDWAWNKNESGFDRNYSAFQLFCEEHGHGQVPKGHKIEIDGVLINLGSWLSNRRHAAKVETIPKRQFEILNNDPYWTWESPQTVERAQTRDLGPVAVRAFIAREGHSEIPLAHIEDLESGPFPLGTWASSTRKTQGEGDLDPELESELDQIPEWGWNQFELAFLRGVETFRKFVRQNGHGWVPRGYRLAHRGKEIDLNTWRTNILSKYRAGGLAEEQREILDDEPGWEWTEDEANFKRHLCLLQRFIDRTGHANVPQKHKEPDAGGLVALGNWLNTRRQDKRSGDLPAEQEKCLTELGISWEPKFDTFQRNLGHAIRRKDELGHSRFPRKKEIIGDDEVNLGVWKNSMKTAIGKKSPDDRRLEALREHFPEWFDDSDEPAS